MANSATYNYTKIHFAEGSAPSTPDSGEVVIYAKSDGRMYLKDDTGAEVAMSGATLATLTTEGDVLYRDSSGLQRLAIGTAGQVLKVNSGATAPEWDDESGGSGGMTHTYVGYNTAGSSWETPTDLRNYLKSITLASAGFLASIGFHVRGTADAINGFFSPRVWADSAGSPTSLLAFGMNEQTVVSDSTSSFPDPGYWVHAPIGIYLPAGTYWIGGIKQGLGSMDIAYDGSGSDKYFGNPSGTPYAIHANHSSVTVSNTTNKYSIRASVLS